MGRQLIIIALLFLAVVGIAAADAAATAEAPEKSPLAAAGNAAAEGVNAAAPVVSEAAGAVSGAASSVLGSSPSESPTGSPVSTASVLEFSSFAGVAAAAFFFFFFFSN